MSKSRDIADSADVINFLDGTTSNIQDQIDNLDTSLATSSKTFAALEQVSLTLSPSLSSGSPVVGVTKEVPQSGSTNNNWDVSSDSENYTRLDSAYATTLYFDGYDISESVYVDNFSIGGQETLPEGIAFNNDGTKMFIVGDVGADVNEYILSTGFDVTTSVFSQNFSVSLQDGEPESIAFNADGTKMFILGGAGNSVYQYTLSIGFDVSSASYDSVSFSVSGEESTPTGIAFNPDGTKMFIVGQGGDDVNEYVLSVGFSVSTAVYSQNFSVASEELNPTGIAFNEIGDKMFIIGSTGDAVNEYILSSSFDVSTASFVDSFSVASSDSSPRDIAFGKGGSKMFIVGDSGNQVLEYSLPLGLALETGSFDFDDVGKTVEANEGTFVITSIDGSCVETTEPTSYDSSSSGSWGMYGLVYNSTDGDLELSSYIDTYNISNAESLGDFSIVNPYGIEFNPSGLKMFVVEDGTNKVSEYNLSDPFDVTTAVLSQSYTIAEDASPRDIFFRPNGTEMFILGASNNIAIEYSLGTAFDLSVVAFTRSVSLTSGFGSPNGLAFNNDGNRMFVTNTTGGVFEYSTGTWNLTSATQIQLAVFTPEITSPSAIRFNYDGTQMFLVCNTNDIVAKYNLSTAFDISTAVYVEEFDTPASSAGLDFDPSGTKMFISHTSLGQVSSYSVGAGAFFPRSFESSHTTLSTDTTYWTDINSMIASEYKGDGSVYYSISTDDRSTWSIIDETDGVRDIVRNNAGTWQYNSNTTYASETWVDATKNTELDALSESVGFADTFDLSYVSEVQKFSLDDQIPENSPRGIAFNNDGTKMFVCDITNYDVNEYILSYPFDISTCVFSQDFDVSAQVSTPNGIKFNNDGTKMFVLDGTGDDINEYDLSVGFDISTSVFSQSFSVSSQEGAPEDLAFNNDGTKMFVVGSAGDEVNEYDLSTGFDVSTATVSQVFSLSAETTLPTGITFNNDGTRMFVASDSNNRILEYQLSTGFDISTASYTSLATTSTAPEGVAFNNDGSKMYVTDAALGTIIEYDTSFYINQMDKAQLDAVTDPNHIPLGNDLDLSIILSMASGEKVPSSDGVSINYDANILNKGAILGTDYDYDFPASDKVRITALAANNLKVRVV